MKLNGLIAAALLIAPFAAVARCRRSLGAFPQMDL